MSTTATASFQIDNWDEEEIFQTNNGPKVTRAQVTKSFSGELEGEGNVEWLMGYREDGTATFVGLERVVGKLGGKQGSFVLRHSGSFDGKTAKAELTIVPGSGSGDLSGLRGDGRFEAGMGEDGKRSVTLDYDL
jgi:hypothetical protein